MRFLHLADLHLDTAFASRSPELAGALRQASRDALSRAVDETLCRELDAVLIAGDLFDSERLSVQTERFLLGQLRRLSDAGVQVVYATGNHDPGGRAGSGGAGPIGEALREVERLRVLDDPVPFRVEVGRGETPVGYVTGAGHDAPRVARDLSAAFPRPPGRLPEVGLLHTQVLGARGAEEHDRYAPSELQRLRASGYTYWALGHVHVRQALSDDPPIHYPGNTQGRTPRETGAKGGLVVDLSRREAPRVEFVELGGVRWEGMHLADLRSMDRLTGLARRIEEAWTAARAEDPGMHGTRWILRAELSGPSPLHRELSVPGARDELREALVPSLGLLDLEVRTAGVGPVRRVADHLDRGDVLGEALRMARDLTDPEGPSPSEVLGIAAVELAGLDASDRPGLDEYLRELLRRGDEDLLDALLTEEDP